MTKQRGEDPAPKSSDDDASPAEFIDRPSNLPGDHKDDHTDTEQPAESDVPRKTGPSESG